MVCPVYICACNENRRRTGTAAKMALWPLFKLAANMENGRWPSAHTIHLNSLEGKEEPDTERWRGQRQGATP